MLNLDLKRASGKCFFSPGEDWPKGYARKGLAEFFLKKSGSQMRKSWKGFQILANLFLGVKSSMTCPSWRKCGSAGMMRQLRLTRKAWSWHHRTQIQKRIEKDRNRVQGLLFSQNFSFWTLRQDSSLKEGLQKANSVLVLEEPLGRRMPMSKYFVWFAYFSLQVNPNSKLRILIFWHEYATAVPTANPTP